MAGVTRALAIDPSSKGFGWAVLEGPERLIDWGHATVSGSDVSLFLERLGLLTDRYRPDTLVLEEPAGSRRGRRVREWLAWAEEAACDRGLAVSTVTRRQVRDAFPSAASKDDIAAEVARLFPELQPPPRRRRIYDAEDSRMAIFTAVSFALTVLREREWDGTSE